MPFPPKMGTNMLHPRPPSIVELVRAGASMLGGRVRFKKFRAGNFIQATRVPHDDARPQPPAMVAAMMRPGPPSSMNMNHFHNSLGHANVKALYETTKQMGIKLTEIQEYCDDCAAVKAIKRTVPKVLLPQVLASFSAYLHGPGPWVPEIHRRCKVPHAALG